ncbi:MULTISPECIES: response regulator transcription factor [unclassified Streptomyces]|uniref:response regulator n=1 Tax=unclassified Streptomyces TaxID=2593676 RepID=UPI000DB93F8D|nr:response regulator transcription factor [Streptomyces sp. PsTaAH-137]MYT73404.1 response regulator [Streptomyces sp. SID8367]RAJ84931.1 DNA-binding NarL/FixJ family response regulator [Streptomyces sp. PsTaAH-137]
MSLRLIVAEDAVLLREGLVGLLQRVGHEVVAAVGDADALVEAVRADRPDLIVTDVRMPPSLSDDGLRSAVLLREEFPDLPVLVLSQYVERSYALRLLDSGGGAGVGYLLKERISRVADFTAAIERVAAGGAVVDPEVITQLVRLQKDPLERLSPREREVLALLAEGRSNANLAAHLFVSEAAVNKHIGNIFNKLDLPVDTEGHRRVLAVLAFLRA